MAEDAELLRQYAETGSEDAFSELVNRHLPLVYSAAVRQVAGDEDLAKDVAQTVFLDLARKAPSLTGRELLAGWLYTATRLAASKACRSDNRRRARELTAAAMQESTIHPSSEAGLAGLGHLLDEAVNELDPEERDAVLLRFFQDKGLAEVGAALGITPDAARMRVNRSLQKLHGILVRRGVTLSVTALGTVIATEAVSAPPAGLGTAIASAALAGKLAAGGTATTLLKTFAMTKLQPLAVGAALVACATVPIALQLHARNEALRENQSLRARVQQLAEENRRLSELATNTPKFVPPPPVSDQTKELLRLRGEVGALKRQLADTALVPSKKAGKRGSQDPEMAKYEEQFDSRGNYASELLRAVLTYQGKHQGQMPARLEAAAPFLNEDARSQTNWTTDQFEIVDPAACSILTNASWGVMIRERQPWHSFGDSWGRMYAWMQSNHRHQSSMFAIENDAENLVKWEAQAKWEMDYETQQAGGQ